MTSKPDCVCREKKFHEPGESNVRKSTNVLHMKWAMLNTVCLKKRSNN